MTDGDAVDQQAIAAGATSVTEMTSLAFGNLWWIQTRLESLDPDEMAKRAADPHYSESMRHLQESLDPELSSQGP
jgi:hypothetical protein